MCSTNSVAGANPSGGSDVACLAARIDALADRDVYATPASALADQVVELHRQLARLQGQITRRVAALDKVTLGGSIHAVPHR